MSKKNHNPQEEESAVYHSILGDEIPVGAEDEEETAEPAKGTASEDGESAGKQSKNRTLKIVGVSAACVAVAACLVYAGVTLYNRQKLNGPAATITGSAENPTEVPESEQINLSVDRQTIACYYKDTVNMFISYYGEEMLKSTYGMDVSKSLKEQDSMYETGKSWFDTLISQATSTMEQQLVVCAAARDAGYTLTDYDKKLIDEAVANADVASYGNGVTEEDIRRTLTIQRYSTSYYQYLLENMEITDADAEAFFEQNKYSYLTCTLGGMALSWAPDEEGNVTMTKEVATDLKNQLEACTNTTQFEELIKMILVDYQGYTVEEVEAAMPTLYNDSYTYIQNNPLAEWAFGDAKANEVFSIENEDSYNVYILKEAPARDDTATIDVRHILFMDENSDNKAKAEAALKEWENGEKTEESFASMANELSEDPGSNTNGGLYEAVTPGQMVDTFDAWCFDPARKPGDSGIVETSYGYHVMYFVDHGDPAWMMDARTRIQDQRYSEWLTQQQSIYTVTLNQDIINSIDG